MAKIAKDTNKDFLKVRRGHTGSNYEVCVLERKEVEQALANILNQLEVDDAGLLDVDAATLDAALKQYLPGFRQVTGSGAICVDVFLRNNVSAAWLDDSRIGPRHSMVVSAVPV